MSDEQRPHALTSPLGLSSARSGDYPHPVIAREGWPFIAGCVAIAVLTHWLAGPWWALAPWFAVAFVVQFFRDPARIAPREP